PRPRASLGSPDSHDPLSSALPDDPLRVAVSPYQLHAGRDLSREGERWRGLAAPGPSTCLDDRAACGRADLLAKIPGENHDPGGMMEEVDSPQSTVHSGEPRNDALSQHSRLLP